MDMTFLRSLAANWGKHAFFKSKENIKKRQIVSFPAPIVDKGPQNGTIGENRFQSCSEDLQCQLGLPSI
jgi:hypothetical protein